MPEGKSTFTKEEFWADFEKHGEDEVSLSLERGEYGGASSDRRALAQEWLRIKERDRSAGALSRIESYSLEQIRIARNGNTAAWIAAGAAIVAVLIGVMTFLQGV